MTSPEFVAALAQGAEEVGATSIWPGEHVVLFPQAAADKPARVGTPDGTFSLPVGLRR